VHGDCKEALSLFQKPKTYQNTYAKLWCLSLSWLLNDCKKCQCLEKGQYLALPVRLLHVTPIVWCKQLVKNGKSISILNRHGAALTVTHFFLYLQHLMLPVGSEHQSMVHYKDK
jgi:hypothetical protein